MLNISKSILLIAISTLIVGCGAGTQPTPSAGNLPQWFLNPNHSNSIFYYGVGEGSSKDTAKANALSQIGGEISISVSADLDMTTTETNGQIDEYMKSQTKSSIEKIKFSGAEVMQNAYNAGNFYSYVKVDRDVLVSAQKNAMLVEYDKLNSLFDSAKLNNIFVLINQKSKIEKLVSTVASKLPILKAINADFKQAQYQSKLDAISKGLRDSIPNAMVHVTHSKVPAFAEVVKQYISSYGMTLVDNPKSVKNKNNLIIVKVRKTDKPKNVKTSDPRLKGASFADVIVTLTTLNSTNKVIAQNRIQVLNISKDGYAAAAIKTPKFENEIKKKGILNILLDTANN